MNLQDAVYLKFSVASTFQEPPVAKITRPSDAIKYFHLHCLKAVDLSVTKMLMKFGMLSRPTDFYLACFYSQRGTWTVHCSPADHAQAVAQSRHLHRGFREASVCKHSFPNQWRRKVLLFCILNGPRKCELLININKILVKSHNNYCIAGSGPKQAAIFRCH